MEIISRSYLSVFSERNSIVFRAGDSPIWNRNETILPMSWRLFKNTITQPGKNYTLQTIPTLSTAMDFDVRKNQPNFAKMLEKRMSQAYIASEAEESYKKAYGYKDFDVAQLDPDNYSDEIMDLIYSTLNPDKVKEAIKQQAESEEEIKADEELEEQFDYMFGNAPASNSGFETKQEIFNEFDHIEDNAEQAAANAEQEAKFKDAQTLRYAGKTISRDMLVSVAGQPNHSLDEAIIRIYKDIRGKMEKDSEYFIASNGNLCGLDGKIYIKNNTSADNIDMLNEAAKDKNSRVFADNDMSKADAKSIGSYEVRDAFLFFLASFPKAWPFADGEFETRMKNEIIGDDNR